MPCTLQPRFNAGEEAYTTFRLYDVASLTQEVLYGVTYRSKFSQGIFPIEKLIFVSEIN